MVKIIAKKFAFFVLVILLASFSSASALVGNASDALVTSYSPETNIKGWINVSLNNEDVTSILESSFGGTIQLLTLLKTASNSGFVFTCTPATCLSNYLANTEDVTKTFTLNENKTALFGMKITATKKVGKISAFHFDVSSNNPITEKMPLAIDILNDGQTEWQAYSSADVLGEENSGCYVGVDTITELIANTPQYCERISLSKTPGVELGAYVAYEKGTGSVTFEMSIQNSDGIGSKKTCQPSAVSGTGIKRLACTPNFPVRKDGEYFVCIRTLNSADNGKYKINAEQTSPCGFTGTYGGTYDYDFDIFARREKYAASISMTLDNDELLAASSPVLNAGSYIDTYITNNYKNDCSKGCVIPIKIYSGIDNQQIDISNAFMSYTADTYTENTNLYDISETPATISSLYQKLFLDSANFSVPASYGDHTFSVKLNNGDLFSKKISVEKAADITLTPTTTSIKFPTKFKVEVSGANITEYRWDFGDRTPVQTTTVKEATHTYNNSGVYSLNMTIKDNKGTISKKNFSITVAKASEIVPTLLDDASSNLDNVKNKIGNFSQFEQASIENALNLSSAEGLINKMNDEVLKAVSESDYEKILGELLTINIPTTLAKTATSEGIVFYPSTDNINLGALKEIGGGNYTAGKDDEYKDAILGWYTNDIQNVLIYSEISLIYENREESLKIFNMHVTKSGTDSAYLIIKDMKNLFLQNKESYSNKKGYFYTNLNGGKDIAFSTTENVDFVNVPMFISPSLSNLVLVNITPPQKISWTFPILIVIIIILIALTIWVILQIWYTRKYESYLFKDRNHLYNLVNYIGDAKKKGEGDGEISSKLKKSGWDSEQVRYALRKYERKNTGLPEIIPIRKLLEGFKKTPPSK
jgi:PKD repeat protein